MARKKNKAVDPNEVLAEITPNTTRRVAAVVMVAGLGALLMIVAAARPPELFGWMLFLTFTGAGSLWLAWAMWHATGRTIELTRTGLQEVDGRVLALVEDVAKVDRGVFAFKPAGGFLLRTKAPLGRVYAPGLWWRMGRTIAVGGTTKRAQTKEVADLLTVLVLQRDGEI